MRIFAIAALLLLIISCINFVNLATARASKRAKEVGVRKAIGAQKRSLIGQFMAEALVISTISVGVSLILAKLLLPRARLLTEKALEVNYGDPLFLGGIFIIIGMTTLLSGAYPSFVLASFRPINTVKGKSFEPIRHLSLRRILVVIQFLLAILLIVGSLVIHKQIDYLKNKKIGINKDDLIEIKKSDLITEKYDVLRASLLEEPGIAMVSSAGPTPIDMQASTSGVEWPGKRIDQTNQEFQILWAEDNFLEAFDVEMAEGQYYRSGLLSDTTNIVLNEMAIEVMELEDPVGKVIQWWGQPRQIIGIIKDFHNRSLYELIQPMAVLLDATGTWSVFVKAKPTQMEDAITSIRQSFAHVLPQVPLHLEFVDEQYQANYEGEVLMGKLGNYFALISILISCLGLFGLTTLFAEQKFKEIGIRKILGASVLKIAQLLSRDFLKMVLLAFLLAVPVSYLLMHHWLEGFAYHIGIPWWVYIIAGTAVLMITIVTISYQSLRSGYVDPVKALRQD